MRKSRTAYSDQARALALGQARVLASGRIRAKSRVRHQSRAHGVNAAGLGAILAVLLISVFIYVIAYTPSIAYGVESQAGTYSGEVVEPTDPDQQPAEPTDPDQQPTEPSDSAQQPAEPSDPGQQPMSLGDSDQQTLTIAGEEVPLLGKMTNWSLFALFATVLAATVFLITLALTVIRRRQGAVVNDYDEAIVTVLTEEISLSDVMEGNLGERLNKVGQDALDKAEANRPEAANRLLIRPTFLVGSALASIGLVAFFALTQNTAASMVVFDEWSWLFAVVCGLGLLASYLTFKRVPEITQVFV